MVMVALVLAGIATVAIIQQQRREMQRLVSADSQQARKRGPRR
jgi:hypothetical protein